MSLTSLTCIICTSEFSISELARYSYEKNTDSLKTFLNKVWSVFSKFYDLSSFTREWNYILNYYSQACEIPFCDLCLGRLVQISKLQKQLEPIENQIKKVITTMSTSIIGTSSSFQSTDFDPINNIMSNGSHIIKFKQRQSQENKSQMVISERENVGMIQDLDIETLQSMIKTIRNNITQRFNPQVVLDNCHEKSRRQPKALVVDNTAIIKQEPIEAPTSPLIECVPCKEEELESMNFNFDDDIHYPQINIKTEYQREDLEKFMSRLEYDKSEDEDDELIDHNDPLYVPPSHITDRTRKPRGRRHHFSHFSPQSNVVAPIRIQRKKSRSKNIVPYPCTNCDKLFTTSFNLMRHTIRVHRKSVKEAKQLRMAQVNNRNEVKRKIKAEQEQLRKTRLKQRLKYIPTILQPATKLSTPGQGETKLKYKTWEYKRSLNGTCVCCTCGTRRSVQGEMKAHIKIHHIMSSRDQRLGSRRWDHFAVDLGNGRFSIKNYEFIQRDDDTFECSTCSKECPSRKRIMEHMKTVHCVELCRFKCHRCNLGFVGRDQMTKHERQHTRQRWWCTGPGTFIYDGIYEFDLVDNSYQCGTCGLEIESIYEMAKHIRDIHAEPHNCQCLKCGEKFMSMASLRKHEKTKVCDKRGWKTLSDGKYVFHHKWFVETYLVVKNGVETKRYRCCTCDQTRLVRQAMADHIKAAHINPGSYPCPSCPSVFNKAYELKTHSVTHSEERPFMCNMLNSRGKVCGQRLKLKRALKVHQSKVHANHDQTYKTLRPKPTPSPPQYRILNTDTMPIPTPQYNILGVLPNYQYNILNTTVSASPQYMLVNILGENAPPPPVSTVQYTTGQVDDDDVIVLSD